MLIGLRGGILVEILISVIAISIFIFFSIPKFLNLNNFIIIIIIIIILFTLLVIGVIQTRNPIYNRSKILDVTPKNIKKIVPILTLFTIILAIFAFKLIINNNRLFGLLVWSIAVIVSGIYNVYLLRDRHLEFTRSLSIDMV